MWAYVPEGVCPGLRGLIVSERTLGYHLVNGTKLGLDDQSVSGLK